MMAFVFSLTGYLGINFVLVLVRSFGALLAVTGSYLSVSKSLLVLSWSQEVDRK